MLPGSVFSEAPHPPPTPAHGSARSRHPKPSVACSSPRRASWAFSPFSFPFVDQCVRILRSVSFLSLALFSLVFLSVYSHLLCLTPALPLPFQNTTWSPVRSPKSPPTASGRACSLA